MQFRPQVTLSEKDLLSARAYWAHNRFAFLDDKNRQAHLGPPWPLRLSRIAGEVSVSYYDLRQMRTHLSEQVVSTNQAQNNDSSFPSTDERDDLKGTHLCIPECRCKFDDIAC